MNEVYVVMARDYEESWIEDIFRSKQAAEERRERLEKERRRRDSQQYFIECHEVVDD